MENEAYKNFKFNVTPINKYAKHHTNDMKQIKKHKRKFFFMFDTFQVNLKTQHSISEYDLGLLIVIMAHQRFREYEETQSYIHYKGKRARHKDLIEMLRLDKNQVNMFKRKMTKLNIIREDEYGMYIDDNITTRGKKTSDKKQFNRVYVDEVKEVYDIIVLDSMQPAEKKQAIKDVGLLFSLLPYMNKTTNELVDEHFNNITMNELKVKLGIGKNANLESRLGNINQRFYDATGKYLIYKLEPVGIQEGRTNKKAFRLIINPRLVFSSTKSVKSRIGEELFGDSDTPNEDYTENNYVIAFVVFNDIFYMKTSNNYNITILNKKIQESSSLLFANKVINSNDIVSIQQIKIDDLTEYFGQEHILKDNELKPLAYNEQNKSNYFKDLYLIK